MANPFFRTPEASGTRRLVELERERFLNRFRPELQGPTRSGAPLRSEPIDLPDTPEEQGGFQRAANALLGSRVGIQPFGAPEVAGLGEGLEQLPEEGRSRAEAELERLASEDPARFFALTARRPEALATLISSPNFDRVMDAISGRQPTPLERVSAFEAQSPAGKLARDRIALGGTLQGASPQEQAIAERILGAAESSVLPEGPARDFHAIAGLAARNEIPLDVAQNLMDVSLVQSPVGKLMVDVRNGVITPEQAEAEIQNRESRGTTTVNVNTQTSISGDEREERGEAARTMTGTILRATNLLGRLEGLPGGLGRSLAVNVGGPAQQFLGEVGASASATLFGARPEDAQAFQQGATELVGRSLPVFFQNQGRYTDLELQIAQKALSLNTASTSVEQSQRALQEFTRLLLLDQDLQSFIAQGGEPEIDISTNEGVSRKTEQLMSRYNLSEDLALDIVVTMQLQRELLDDQEVARLRRERQALRESEGAQ